MNGLIIRLKHSMSESEKRKTQKLQAKSPSNELSAYFAIKIMKSFQSFAHNQRRFFGEYILVLINSVFDIRQTQFMHKFSYSSCRRNFERYEMTNKINK